jgi:hypothetical protein
MKQTIESKFETVIESYINGQIAQAKTQFKKLKKSQRIDMIEYIRDLMGDNQTYSFFLRQL